MSAYQIPTDAIATACHDTYIKVCCELATKRERRRDDTPLYQIDDQRKRLLAVIRAKNAQAKLPQLYIDHAMRICESWGTDL